MKKTCSKILIATTLATSTLLITEVNTKPSIIAEAAPAVIWKHPSVASKIGKSFSTTTTITRTQLNKISTHIDNRETGENVVAGLAATIITTPLTPKFSLSIGIGVTLLTTYRNTHGKLVSAKLKESSAKNFKVKVNYNYKQAGSNDGYYYVSTIKIY